MKGGRNKCLEDAVGD